MTRTLLVAAAAAACVTLWAPLASADDAAPAAAPAAAAPAADAHDARHPQGRFRHHHRGHAHHTSASAKMATPADAPKQ